MARGSVYSLLAGQSDSPRAEALLSRMLWTRWSSNSVRVCAGTYRQGMYKASTSTSASQGTTAICTGTYTPTKESHAWHKVVDSTTTRAKSSLQQADMIQRRGILPDDSGGVLGPVAGLYTHHRYDQQHMYPHVGTHLVGRPTTQVLGGKPTMAQPRGRYVSKEPQVISPIAFTIDPSPGKAS